MRKSECGMRNGRKKNAEVGMRNEAISDLRLRIAEFGIRIDRSEV
jgi:hypothetical protein